MFNYFLFYSKFIINRVFFLFKIYIVSKIYDSKMEYQMIGKLFNNRYKCIKLIGSGSFANVYLVNDEQEKK